ncbi:nuclear transport factor 2 family protein [Maribacter sp. CXY002]|uniref:nuclear transport factor 2 family protein n=1 Tax=Maribacter luteocoastalis TaxID=3407671 RepID=UPI003B683917
MKKNNLIFFFLTLCVFVQGQTKDSIASTLDAWHLAASNANFDAYFGLMTEDAIFIGTDATENWGFEAFKTFSKPYFDRGKAWSFTAIERNIFINETEDIAWFDELLNTQMKICRGSGVLKKVDGHWMVAHYVLSIAVPNEYVDELVELKKVKDDSLIIKLSKN